MRSRLLTPLLFLAVIAGLSFVGIPAHAQETSVQVLELSPSGYEQGLAVSVSPNGGQVAVGLSSGIVFYHVDSLLREYFIQTGSWVRSLAYSPDGQTLAAGLFDGTARIWRISDGSLVHTFEGHTGWVRSIAFSSDGELVVTAADDDTVRVWSVEDGSLQCKIEHLEGIRVLALSPDDHTLAVGLQDSSIKLFDFQDGSPSRTLSGHEDWVRSLAFSPDGKKLASGAFDATARIWDVASGRLEVTLDGHQSSVLGLAFSPDGQTLASGSVDTTVKLWDVKKGRLLQTLVGHTDFVYGVAFSPDGRFVISSAGDNTARLWDVSAPDLHPVSQPPTSSDCRDCHHPRGSFGAPRVLQMSCEACHTDGIGLNWCASFPRSVRATSETSYVPSVDPVGVPVSADNLAVVIAYPTNGETLYASRHHLSPVFVRGRVFYQGDKTSVHIRLEVWAGDSLAAELSTEASEDGSFIFSLAANPQGAPVVAGAKAADPDCTSCHEDFKSQAFLPDGLVHLAITASLPDGAQAFDERWVTVDTSGRAEVDVQVRDVKSGEPIPGLPVYAETILYEWRDRYSRQTADDQGVASLSLEALSQTKTHYTISVPPTSLNGYLYESIRPVTVDLASGSTSDQPVTVYVETKRGRIAGTLSGIPPEEAREIWAVHLPEGILYKTSSVNGTFLFEQIPSGIYRIFAITALGSVQPEPIDVDLTRNAKAEVNIELTRIPAGSIAGRVFDEEGNPLPFVWVTTGATTRALGSLNGTYSLFGLEQARTSVVVDAPGYYSQAGAVDLTATSQVDLDFSLVRRPETMILPWGEGQIVLPPETAYTSAPSGIKIENGWVWGMNAALDRLDLQVGGMNILVTKGSFALEVSSNGKGWFYLKDGEAVLTTEAGQEIELTGTQMAAISTDFSPLPVPYEMSIVSSLHPSEPSPFQSKWEPTLEARIRDRLARVGISLAQVVTFVTYVLVQIVIVTLLIGGIYSIWKYIRKSKA
jgi:WD40 repeat protein